MSKTVVMIIDGDRYPYGTYPCDTPEQQNRINEIAEQVKRERNVDVEVV